MATASELRSRIAEFLQARFPPPSGPAGPAFSAFDRAQVEVATELAQRFGEVAGANGDIDGVADVLEAAMQETRRRSASLVKYALLIFLTHDPIGSQIGPPTLEQRHPTAVRGMVDSSARRTAHDPTSLSFFREDVYANDHHAHWHQVYTSDYQRTERQGELFVYMHRQMLARYDHERLGVGRPAVEKLDLASGVIEEGFDPRLDGFGVRDDNTPIPQAPVLRQREQAFYAAIDQGLFRAALEQRLWNPALDVSGPEPELAILAAALEAEGQQPLRFAFDGLNLHNSGHRAIALVSHDEAGAELRGAMWDPAVAIRDPVFWQWHMVIDDIAATWEDAQPARDFSADEDRGPQIEVLDPIICRRSEVSGDFGDASDWAETTFGDAHWDGDFSATAPATDELLTHMTSRTGPAGDEIVYLDMVDEFALVVRLDNPGEPVDVTLRVFLVAEQWCDERRRWIELDKFLHTVPSGRSVAYRPSSQSSVVRKPVTRVPGPPPPELHRGNAYCACGWPYNLLLPRGTTDGMAFRLLVLATDAAWDRDDTDPCGSMSFCGLRDSRYPDKRSMGYPFERRLAGGPAAALGGLANAGMRTLTIRCERMTPA